MFSSETAHENMAFNAEPRASANTHNQIQGCPESQRKTNTNRRVTEQKKKKVHVFAREWGGLM